MNRPNLTQLSKEIYEANKAKGWHDKEYSNEHYLCLVISELMEAVEADRKGRRADLDKFIDLYNYYKDSKAYEEFNGFKNHFEKYIKDSVSDELADAVIRLLDLAGVRGIPIAYDLNITEDKKIKFKKRNFFFTEVIFDIISCIYENKLNMDELLLTYAISKLMKSIEGYCVLTGIDLWLHVDLKLKYNLTRPYKHGKEY